MLNKWGNKDTHLCKTVGEKHDDIILFANGFLCHVPHVDMGIAQLKVHKG
jgi:hypothetical protein